MPLTRWVMVLVALVALLFAATGRAALSPTARTGEPVLRHTFKGTQIAERIDARGVVFRYFYDALDRLRWVVVGSYEGETFNFWLPSSMREGPIPVDRVMCVQYIYNAEGRLSDVIARSNPEDLESVITHTRYQYDERGNLIREWQGSGASLGQTPPADTPKVDYTWDYAATNTAASPIVVGHDRLASMTYPLPPGATTEAERRVVLFEYGASGSVDNFISRISQIKSGYNTINLPVATFTYAGVSTRAAMTLSSGNGAITADLRASDGMSGVVGLPGLDMFGRVRDLHYKNAAATPQTLFRAKHAYDLSGNRLYDRVTQWESSGLHDGTNHVLDGRSQLHGYDSLHRLISSKVGVLNGAGNQITDELRNDQWWLDLIGNWQADQGTPSTVNTGRLSRGELDGGPLQDRVSLAGGSSFTSTYQAWQDFCASPDGDADTLHHTQQIDERNEVTASHARTTATGAYTQTTAVRYDAAGNLAFDGTYIYQFDAWGRLVQVNAGAVDPAVTPMPESPYYGLVFGPMLKHYTFDGLGRLVRTQSPFPTPQLAQNGEVRSERFYYDGIRRIQEVRTDPTMSLMMAVGSGDPEAQTLGETALQNAQEAAGGSGVTLETSAATMELEGGLQQLNSGPGMGELGGPVLAREYVWGPGDAWHAPPVDELLVYYGEGRVAYWPIQDAGGDVVAVCAPGGSGEGYKARVAAQQRYDAYGQVISADHIHPHAFLSVGHKGLFYDRLDRGVADDTATGAAIPPNAPSFSGYETPQVVPFSRGTYHVRNRTYIPGGGSPTVIGTSGMVNQGTTSEPNWVLSQGGLSSGSAVCGRWMQVDPHATGAALIESIACSGALLVTKSVPGLDIDAMFRDGANRYQYIQSNSAGKSDPLGLYTPAEGYAVEAAVQDLYEKDHPGHTVKRGKWVHGVPLKPDIVNYTNNTWVEVKPLSPRGILAAGVQGGTYSRVLFTLFGMLPDTAWTPSSDRVYAAGRHYNIYNMGGIVFYASMQHNLEDAALASGAAAAYGIGSSALAANAVALGESAIGRMVFGLLGGSMQSLGLSPGVLAGASMNSLEIGVSSTTLRQSTTRSFW